MEIETILHYIDVYGYVIIFLFLFFGIVGIPAPEESLLFLLGVLIVHHTLSFEWALLSAFLGAFSGMLTAYMCGKYLGTPFVNKYGKYVGITIGRWQKVQKFYTKNVQKTIVFGFYLPGIRQISPYFAGMSRTPFGRFAFLSMLGTLLWITPFIAAGYYLGKIFHINPAYVPYVSVLFLVGFLVYVMTQFILKQWRSRRKRGESCKSSSRLK